MLEMAAIPAVPVLLAVPHAGRTYPDQITANMRRPDDAKLRLEDRYMDLVAHEVAKATGAPLLIAHTPRAIIDLNRAVEDMDWGMVSGGRPEKSDNASRLEGLNRRARSGLGLIPRRMAGHGEIWRKPLSASEVEARVSETHRPYHRALSGALERIRDHWGGALLIDCHSMPPLKSAHIGQSAAEWVVGDRFGASADGALVAKAMQYLARQERLAAHNRPYAGGYVLDRHAAPRRNIHAIQLEVCRSAYLDSRLSEPGPRLSSVARIIAGLVRELASEMAAMSGRPYPLAAE
ncbi:N-formylglutamate deformylase [Alteripontixanthobacter maritimus]|uniref:N-formylglutamate deformylase n=2 Tax=Alteripontixanthobacter maritimus TaxID=2161824 RepID=A0A369Q5P7_9SPHN|nr:N-formylglutamate deformylase [Alteripontixanthobacter maritimus]